MQSGSESERFVLFSERIIIECRCGERLVLLGLEEDWFSEGRTAFECECGRRPTLADRFYKEETTLAEGFDKEARDVRDLLRGLKVTGT